MQILIQSRHVQHVVQSYPPRAQETKGQPQHCHGVVKEDSQRDNQMQIVINQAIFRVIIKEHRRP